MSDSLKTDRADVLRQIAKLIADNPSDTNALLEENKLSDLEVHEVQRHIREIMSNANAKQ